MITEDGKTNLRVIYGKIRGVNNIRVIIIIIIFFFYRITSKSHNKWKII